MLINVSFIKERPIYTRQLFLSNLNYALLEWFTACSTAHNTSTKILNPDDCTELSVCRFPPFCPGVGPGQFANSRDRLSRHDKQCQYSHKILTVRVLSLEISSINASKLVVPTVTKTIFPCVAIVCSQI